jgi:Maf1 regulator
MDNFLRFPVFSLPSLCDAVNTNFYNAGIAKGAPALFNEFTGALWATIDDVILFEDCEIYSYIPDLDANPFCESQSCL